jgi:hypothetical protein
MARSSCPVKVQQWVDRIQRFSNAGTTVIRFCAAEGVSVPSFYNWKKKLRLQAGSVIPSALLREPRSGRNAFQAIELIPASPSTVTIRLPNGIVIELDGDSRATDRLFERAIQSPVDSARGWSC